MDELQQHLRKLEAVKKGDKLRAVLTADRINALQGAVKCLAKGDAIKTAGGLSKTSTTNAVILRGAEKTDEFVPQLEPYEVRVLGLPASYLDGYSAGHYITCNLGYVTNLVDETRVRPSAVTYNSVVQSVNDINGSIDMGWFKGDILSPGGSDVHVWLGYVTDVNGKLVASPTYEYSHWSPGIWFTIDDTPPIAIGAHPAASGYGTDRYRFIHIAKVHYDSIQGWVVTQYHKGNVLIDSDLGSYPEPPPWLSPWQCYITANAPGSVALKINPISTLMRFQGYRDYFHFASWKDKMEVTGFSNSFTLTDSSHCVWMECAFDADGKMTSATINHGLPADHGWSADLPYEDGTSTPIGSSQPFTWRQLLAYFKTSETGETGDVSFSSTWYRLMCPTTTHLAEGIVRGCYGYTADIRDFPAIIPWHACWTPGGS